MSYQTILFGIVNGAARLTLNRPEKLNAFNIQMHEEVRAALDEAERGRARALLLTGAGRGFCAGQDLNDRAVAPGEKLDLGESVEHYYAPLVRRLQSLPMPVVCGVNGVAAGAGANIALACDIVIAVRSASFVEPFCKLGLIPDTGGTFFLPRLLGRARAMGMALLGERIAAPQAEEWGLIWRCVGEMELEKTCGALVAQLAAGPTLGLARTRQAMYASASNTLEQQLDLERDFMRELGRTEDYREGVAAFLEKRQARFIGR